MKPRPWMLVLVVVLVALFWLLWPRAVQPDRPLTQQPETLTSSTSVKATAPAQPSGLPNPSASGAATAHAHNLSNQVEVMRKLLEEKNVPIDFYGQTVDQDGNPLSDVDVTVQVRHYGASVFGTSIRVDRKSDSAGMFDIHGVTGDAFDLENMSKKGYEAEPTHSGWGAIGGAPGNPVVFKLWRNDIKEPLITGRDALDILADGRPYVINITNNAITEGKQGSGDVIVWVKRPAGITWSSRFDWSCELQVIGGTLQEDKIDEAMYIAPQDGYSNTFHFDASNGWGKTTGTRRFYLHLQNGDYGRASIEILPYFRNQEPGLIRIEYAINPTGSRILR